jgi:biotin operon repressor
MKTSDKIIRLIKINGQISVNELAEKFQMSRQYIHRVLNELEDQGAISKLGSPPKVFYSLALKPMLQDSEVVSFDQEFFLNEHFIIIDAMGNLLEGEAGIHYWCQRQNLPIQKTILEFIETRKKYLEFYNQEHLIDGLQKLKKTEGIGQIGVDALFYLDFYAIERFGKTRLGTLMHYAKQGQNKSLMKLIVSETRQAILRIIKDQSITALVYVPPTIKRNLQIMDYLKKYYNLELPIVKVEKLKSPIVVPQKALSKIFERVANAKNTFNVPNQPKYDHVLIIDDAIGSGATINEIALKIKQKSITTKITGLAITGSYKGFEVISEL